MIGNYVHYHSGKTAERIFYEHNVAVGCEAVAQPQFTHIQMLSALNSHYQHNTFAPNMAQTYDYRFASNSDCIPAGTENFPFFPEIGRSYNAGVRDNIIGYGNGAYLGNPNTATCWPTIANDIQKNIIVDTESVGTSTINMAFPNNFPVANYTSFWAGTCAYDSWQNCKLAAENPNRGAASDGGDPGADIEQVRDRIERWSERAGLLQSNPHTALMELNPSSWQVGSTHVAVRFTLTAPLSACTVELFTTRNRSALHADSNAAERLPCARAGSFVEDNMAVFVFGTFAPLSPSKKYFYRITDGPRVMVGEFSTVGARSGAFLWPLQLPAASTLTYASNADFTGAATLPSSTQHSLPVASGAVVYWRVDASGKKAVSIAP